jgi:hypothetical protein
MRHVLCTVPESHGFQYGMLRDFEDEIVRLTGASVVPIPEFRAPEAVKGRLAHGTRYAPLRRFVPKRLGFQVDADVLWLVLMGPESSWLDLYRAWDKLVGYRILYVYDTFAEQLPALRRLLGAAKWDLLITSFHCAVPMLERETGRKWHAVAQGVKLDRFAPVPEAERVIAWSSYGRRLDVVNDGVERFCDGAGLHFDATVAATLQRAIPPAYLYKQYAWHLRHSWFTLAWPVELTSPKRAGSLSPITCRWFEAAASNTTLVGDAPKDPAFVDLFGPDLVVPLDPKARRPEEIREATAAIWDRREELLRKAEARRAERAASWTWEARVREMLALAGLEAR